MSHGLSKKWFDNTTNTGKQFIIHGNLSGTVGSGYINKQVGSRRYDSTIGSDTGRLALVGNETPALNEGFIKVYPFGAGNVEVGHGANLTAVMELDTATINVGGSGYEVGDTISVGNGTVITVSTVDGSGVILTFALTNRGSFTTISSYTGVATSAVSSDGIDSTFNLTFRLKDVTIVSGGVSYDVAPTVTIDGNATITVTRTNGVITSKTVTAVGSGYTSIPVIHVTANTEGAVYELAHKINRHVVVTFSGNTYKWNKDIDASVDGEADIESA